MKKEKAPLGLYIHIPFCRQKCAYCDFYSLPSREDKMDAYTDALIRHIREVAPRTESPAPGGVQPAVAGRAVGG